MDRIWTETLARLDVLEERVGRIELGKDLSSEPEPEPKPKSKPKSKSKK